ncbi:hypothetical protein BGZ95_012085 [Linnemannia exigua]|uniref:Uncharacterized protein n=1 Tax=Linnemannia exigua TaxID=604196 RepID=A0AAD4H5Z5_9FUNG|nr:hypothetical protein BGZ95_012085 [Linnemannia exigua]
MPPLSDILLYSPNILLALTTHLTPHDLSQTILTSKTLAQLLTPLLWHTISLRHDYQQQLFAANNSSIEVQLPALLKNANYIHIIRVPTTACLAPFITLSGLVMKNLHTLEFPWVRIPLIVSRGLAPPGQADRLWSLFKLEGESEYAENEMEKRIEEETRMALDAERMTRQALLLDGINGRCETAAEPETAKMMQDWLRYRAMYPVRRQEIMKGLISTRAYHAYQQARIRYSQELNQQLRQRHHTTLLLCPAEEENKGEEKEEEEEENEGEEKDEEEEEAKRKWGRTRCRLQDVVEEIATPTKTRTPPNYFKHYQPRSTPVSLTQAKLRETFSERLLQLEKDEADLRKRSSKGNCKKKKDLSSLCATLQAYVLNVKTLESDPYYYYKSMGRTVDVATFLQLFPTILTFRDYYNQVDCQYLWREHSPGGIMLSFMNAMRHLSWTISHQSLDSRNSFEQPLVQFLRSTYLRLDSLRMSLVYPPGVNMAFYRPTLRRPYGPSSWVVGVVDDTAASSCLGDDKDKNGTEAMNNCRIKEMQRSGPIPSLTQLFLEDSMGSGTLSWSTDYRIPPWVPFLSRCPNLRSFALGSCPPTIWFEIARILQAHCPRLEDLAIAYGRQLPTVHLDKCDPALAALLFACSHPNMDDTFGQDDVTITEEPIEPAMGLKRLRLDALVLTPKSQALRMLLDYHSGSLTHLAIMDCRNLQMKTNRFTLLKILRSFEQLEEVHLLPSGEMEYVEEDHIFDGQALIDSITLPTQYTSATATWACAKSLRVLRMMIGGLGRTPSSPLITTVNNSNAMDTTADGHLDLQRKIYRFLGSLTALEELSLGFGPEDNSIFTLLQHQGRQNNCLEFSLDSGVELLGGLKSLRVLNVARMNHKIGLAEVQWMCSAWPRLHLMEGLLKIKSMEQWMSTTNDAIVGWSDNLREDRRRESEILHWLKEHRPQFRFT